MGLLELFGLELQVLLVTAETLDIVFFRTFDHHSEWEAFNSIQLQGKIAVRYELVPGFFAPPQRAHLKFIHS